MAHINVNSFRNKFEPFREVLLQNIFDILSIQETKLDDSFPDAQFNVSMYTCIHVTEKIISVMKVV